MQPDWSLATDGRRITAADCAGREQLLRYCAQPHFALDWLLELGPEPYNYDVTAPVPRRRGAVFLRNCTSG